MDIQVWSDVVCPWCYLGKRRLERAVAEFPGEVRVTYRAFQLEPSAPSEPLPIKDAMAAKFGGRGQAERMFDHVTAVAAADGIRLDFDRAIAANTFDSHRLIAWAARQNRQAAMLDALQRAHFAAGVDIGSRPALATVAGQIGLDPAGALDYLASEAGAAEVRGDMAEARQIGIGSVPTFVIDDQYIVEGAQQPETLLYAMTEIAEKAAVEADY